MTIITLEEAQKWFVHQLNGEELKQWRNPIYVKRKYEEEHPNHKVIVTNVELTLGKQRVTVDPENKILTFRSIHGSYRARTKHGWKDIIRLNKEILDFSKDEDLLIRIEDLKNHKQYLLDDNEIYKVRHSRPVRKGESSLYPVFVRLSLEEKSTSKKIIDKSTKPSEDLTNVLI